MTTEDSPFDRLKEFAALSGPFSPASAMRSLGLKGLPVEQVSEIASRLSELCDVEQSDSGETWLLKRGERQWILKSLEQAGRLVEALGERQKQQPFDRDAQDLATALSGEASFALPTLENFTQRLESLKSLGADALEPVQHIATALERLGDLAPGSKLLPRLYGLLNREADTVRRETILTERFSGREDQIDQIVGWINRPNTAVGGKIQCLLVRGIPGIGKSALLEAACERVEAQGQKLIVVRFDFDRPALDVLDPVGLTLEFARQVGTQVPEHAVELKARRLAMASAERLKGSRDTRYELQEIEVIDAAQQALTDARARLLLVLDTLEVLRGRGPSHPLQLFAWIDRIAQGISGEISVIAAGRGEPLMEIPERIGDGGPLDLVSLSDDEMNRMLAKSEIGEALWPSIRDQANGNPMMVRIVGEIARQDPASLKKAGGAEEGAQAALNRWLFARFQNPDLRRMAEHGLFLREITVEAISTLWPKLVNAPALSMADARHVYDELVEMNWLLKPSPDGVGLRMRPEFRGDLLASYYTVFGRRALRADKLAAAWFGKLTSAEAAVDALYHGLQAMRGGGAAPAFSAETAYLLDEQSISELPIEAQDVLRHARHERSESSRIPTAGPDLHSIAIDLSLVLEKGDWGEAEHVYRQIPDVEALPPAEDLAYIVRAFQWKTGRWAAALRSLRRYDRVIGPNEDEGRLGPLSPAVVMAHLEMRAEFGLQRFAGRVNEDVDFRAYVTRSVFNSLKSDTPFGGLGLALSFTRADTPRGRLRDIALCWENPADPSIPSEPGRLVQAVLPGLFGSPDQAALTARSCAALTPYYESVQDMPGEQSKLVPAERLAELVDSLRNFDLPINGGLRLLDGQIGQRLQPLSILRDTGLLAEALGVLAIEGHPDIRLIASRAEFWRKLAAGRRPSDPLEGNFKLRGWRENLDATLWFRIRELASQQDPIGCSYDCLRAWLVADGGRQAPLIPESSELGGKLRRVREAISTKSYNDHQAARLMLNRAVPTALIPPLAILFCRGLEI